MVAKPMKSERRDSETSGIIQDIRWCCIAMSRTIWRASRAAGTREQDLIPSVQRGQQELFYELVRPYERRVYAAALAILRNEQDAEDAAQEAMLKAFENIRQFRAEAASAPG